MKGNRSMRHIGTSDSRIFTILLIVVIYNFRAFAQEEKKKFTVDGYITDLPSASNENINNEWDFSNLVHNRLNFKYYPASGLSSALELRTRFSMDNKANSNTATALNFATDDGFMNLSKNIAKGNDYVLNSTIDRIWFAYEKGKFHATAGRQRINWGQSIVWNPNDIFNAYSFFDIDYVERPGSDAVRLQYYNSEVSSTELAVKMNSNQQITAAGLYKFNMHEYDFQVLAGILNQTDYVAGIGWSGAIKSIAFRGEVSYFQPKKNIKDTTGVLLASVSFDHTFGNSLYLLAEYLYDGKKFNNNFSFQTFYNAPASVKDLSFVKHNLIVEASYPITPLLTGSIAGLYLPGINGLYIGPSFSYSLSKALDASIYLQSLNAKVGDNSIHINIFYLKLKYSF